MPFFIDACVVTCAFLLYWCIRDRRKYLKQRIENRALRNVYETARNIGHMLMHRDLCIDSTLGILSKGGVLYSFHFGIWESVPRALARAGCQVGIVVNRYTDSKHRFASFADRMLYAFRDYPGVHIFYKSDSLKLIRFVRKGGVLAMLVDGNDLYSKFHYAQKISRLCNVPLIPFAAYRQKGKGVLKIGCELDALLKRRPLDYVWYYKSRLHVEECAA